MAKQRPYYHATPIENFASVLAEGLRAGLDGCVHLTTSKEKAMLFMMLRPGVSDFALLRVRVRDSKVTQHIDGTMSGDDCFVFEGNIGGDSIKNAGFYSLRR